MAGLVLALQFFTRVPIPISVEFSEKNMRIAFYFLPIIGLLFGGIVVVSAQYFPSSLLASVISVLLVVLLGQSLHLDGLADSADAFFASASSEKTLAILKDPHIGTFGVIALILDLLVRVLFYSDFFVAPFLLLLPPFLSRAFVLLAVAYGKPVKQEGLGAFFNRAISKFSSIIYACFSILIFFLLVFLFNYSFLFLFIPFCNIGIVFLILYFTKKKIGGTTGDINGAIIEVLELFNLFAIYVCWLF